MDHRWPERLAEQVRAQREQVLAEPRELAREQRDHPKVRALPAEQARVVRAQLVRREQVQVRPARLAPAVRPALERPAQARLAPEPLARAAREQAVRVRPAGQEQVRPAPHQEVRAALVAKAQELG
jgi:hypothetical protein